LTLRTKRIGNTDGREYRLQLRKGPLSTYQRRFQKAGETLARVKKLLTDAELREQQARNKRKQNTLASARLFLKFRLVIGFMTQWCGIVVRYSSVDSRLDKQQEGLWQ
jgi:hypothetical protein